jgi:hypothetical protein
MAVLGLRRGTGNQKHRQVEQPMQVSGTNVLMQLLILQYPLEELARLSMQEPTSSLWNSSAKLDG